ncbi:MAG: hypothetical protein NWQ38_14020 [Cellulophaga sp.]|nr:hypothetical protein [Cellulophaga sp.]
MTYLSPQIAALAKKNKVKSLVKKQTSCGIFQEYGLELSVKENQNLKKE